MNGAARLSLRPQLSAPLPVAARPPRQTARAAVVTPLAGARGKEANAPSREREKAREAYKYFDEAVITVKAGDGGDGEAARNYKPKTVKNFKYQPGRQQRKFIELPPPEPADGSKGADVLLYVDMECESLLHLREKGRWTARRGLDGTAAPMPVGDRKRVRAPPPPKALRIPVPPGTVVRTKRTRTLLGDLVRPGQTLLVAEGGRGGLGARRSAQPVAPKSRRKAPRGGDPDDPDGGAFIEVLEEQVTATKGEPGEELALELLLRVVADVGIVGFPNAGKSSLLAAVTRAEPEVAPYPFTTLMPNLGVVDRDPANPTVLADLPGLIEGAHRGRGLGRAFLRHLRRTRGMVVVVDASGGSPLGDYLSVREELRLYNPEYATRPHVLALNKIDVEGVAERLGEIRGELAGALEEEGERLGRPEAVVCVSAVTGENTQQLLKAVQGMVQGIKDRGADEAGLAEMGDEWDGAVAAMLAAEEKEREREQQREGGGAAAGAAR